MSTFYGKPLLFKSKYVCNRSGSIQASSSTTKVEDALLLAYKDSGQLVVFL